MKLLKNIVVLASIALVLNPSMVLANWDYIADSHDGDKLLVRDMRRNGNLVTFWEAIIEPGEKTATTAQLITADCATGRYQIKKQTDSISTNTNVSPIYQAPLNTFISEAIVYVCNRT